ncbi:MAG: hypothetical protein R3F59_14455 [Myxococcota bacterium]
MMTRTLAAALLLAASPAASALAPRWGVGPQLGTSVLPSGYPIAFPPALDDATTLSKVRPDLSLGAVGYVWVPSGVMRGGISADVDLGPRFVQSQIIGTVERSFDLDAAYVDVGGGMGFSSATWRGTDPDERLRVPSYPVRLQLGVVTPISDFIALEGRLYTQVAFPLRHTYTDPTGTPQDLHGAPLAYTSFGIELSALYGLFR